MIRFLGMLTIRTYLTFHQCEVIFEKNALTVTKLVRGAVAPIKYAIGQPDFGMASVRFSLATIVKYTAQRGRKNNFQWYLNNSHY